MADYGYVRISNPKQNIERQVRNILAVNPKAIIIREVYTGTKLDRPEWNKLMKIVRAGDSLTFDSVSRMSRDEVEGFTAYKDLFERDISLAFLNEPHINTETYKKALHSMIKLTGTPVDFIIKGINEYLLALAQEQIKIAFQQAQKEVDDLHTRTSQGLMTAKLNGKRVGTQAGDKLTTKKSIVSKEVIQKHSLDFNGTLRDSEVIRLTGLARNTYYKYKRELKAEQGL